MSLLRIPALMGARNRETFCCRVFGRLLHIERAIHEVDVFQPYRTTLVFDTNAIKDDISQLKAVKEPRPFR